MCYRVAMKLHVEFSFFLLTIIVILQVIDKFIADKLPK